MKNGQRESEQARLSLWQSVAKTLRAEIQTFEPGQQLATEIGLSERFAVSRFTIRRALAELEKDGLIRIEHGRGLFVSEDVVPYTIGERTRFSENLRRQNLTGHRQILGIVRERADARTCEGLKLRPGAMVFSVESIISTNGRPLGVGRNAYPTARFPDLDAALRDGTPSTEALKRFGIDDYKRKSTSISGRMPTEREARLLKIARTRPVLEVEKIDVDLSGKPITFGVGCHSADRVQFVIEW